LSTTDVCLFSLLLYIISLSHLCIYSLLAIHIFFCFLHFFISHMHNISSPHPFHFSFSSFLFSYFSFSRDSLFLSHFPHISTSPHDSSLITSTFFLSYFFFHSKSTYLLILSFLYFFQPYFFFLNCYLIFLILFALPLLYLTLPFLLSLSLNF